MYRFKVTNYCEFDKPAAHSYSVLHNVPVEKNLGDITQVKKNDVKPFDFLCGGSPCQDFSVNGQGKGCVWECLDCQHKYNPIIISYKNRKCCPKCGSKNIKKTRSSLLIYYLNFVRAFRPKFGIYENVPAICNNRHKETFNAFVNELKSYGYNVYWQILNAKDYQIPQNRERVFVVYVRKDLDNGKFEFPKAKKQKYCLGDFINENYDYVSKRERLCKHNEFLKKKTNAINVVFFDELITYSVRSRIVDKNGIYPCLTRGDSAGYFSTKDKISKKISGRNMWRFFGFSDEEYKKCYDSLIENNIIKRTNENKNSVMRGLAGNSIVVNCPYYIFVELFKVMPYLFADLRVCSLFSGIGAFEKALKLLYEKIRKME